MIHDCVIVGAGVAGITAARLLKDEGINSVVLEANNRIGGRINTSHEFGFVLDLGASWIHGITNNPTYALCQRYNIAVKRCDYFKDGKVFAEDGQALTDQQQSALFQHYQNIVNFRLDSSSFTTTPKSMVQSLEIAFDHLQSTATQRAFITQHQVSYEGAELDQVTYYTADDYIEFSGDHVILPQGYTELLKRMAQGLDIHLNSQVKQIVQSDDYITVKTDAAIYVAKHVIISVPLGVLKAGEIRFVPPLSKQKQYAIDHLGVGMLNKIAFVFPEAITSLPKQPCVLHQLAQTPDKTRAFVSLGEISDRRAIVAYLAGQLAHELEGDKKSTIIEEHLQALRQIISADLPDPEIKATRWYSEPFSRGAYSFIPVGGDAELLNVMAASEGRIHFVGEATSAQHYGNVHAAVQSARRVVEML